MDDVNIVERLRTRAHLDEFNNSHYDQQHYPLLREAAATISGLTDERERLMAAFEAAERICKVALPKFNWAKSALDAEAIQALNEGMLTIERTRAALATPTEPVPGGPEDGDWAEGCHPDQHNDAEDRISFPRWWVEQALKMLEGVVLSGRMGDDVFLLRGMLKDKLAASKAGVKPDAD